NLNVDIEKIKYAFILAEESHVGQFRLSGENYILHPVEVTKILIDLKMDTETIIAGILHDIVEDTLITIADIEYNFGTTIAEIVDGVTKLENLPSGPSNRYESIRKMILAMSKNLSVIMIKLADRLHNMRTLKYKKPERQEAIARETLDIYAPLAHRIGIAKIKWELEDLCLEYLHPKEYKELKSLLDVNKSEREEFIEKFIEDMRKIIEEENKLEVTITGRFKHYYSIYKKIYEKGKSFGDIYDMIGIRIIAADKAACYHILGIVQSKYKPVPGRFKDYISVPKANNYQSIHTTIIDSLGNFVEVQIRTEEMNRIAEEGIAAHWNYKEKTSFSAKNDEVYGWLRGVIESQQNENSENSEQFVKGFTEELLKESVFVCSPLGDVIELAMGATPIDFAFTIHTDVGGKCVGAKVNGKIVQLDYKLATGDKVEIITSKNAKGPSKDWLNVAVTTGAKNKIRKWLREQNYNENVELGKDLVEKEAEKMGMTLKDFEEEPAVKKHLEKHNVPDIEELYSQIAEKRSLLDVVIDKIKLESEKEKEKEKEIETIANLSEMNNEKREKT
ncbi:MAG: RelA/SpoT family protein, partial [Fusobacteriaceae bacterium]